MGPERQATLFCRVSSAKQQNNYSREAQQRLGEEYAARHGLKITRVYHVVETASKKEQRKKWGEYLEIVRHGPESHALIATVDRALRNYADLHEVAELQKQHGKTVHFFLEGLTLDGAHAPTAKLQLGISAAVAVYGAGELAEKTRRGVNQKALRGEWPNRAPYGYMNLKKRLAINPEQAPWVRRIIGLSGLAQHSLDAIVEILYAEGCTLYGKRLHRTLVERIIRNPIYAGRFEWPVGSGNWITGVHESIVSWSEHRAAIAGLERRNLPRFRKHNYTFAGMIRCGCCPEGRAVVINEKKGGRFVYAHCTGVRNSKVAGARVRMCPDAEFVPLGVVDAQVKEALSRVQISYDLADSIYAGVAAKAGKRQAEAEASMAILRGKIQRLGTRLERLYADKVDGKITEAFWRAHQKRWGDEKVHLEAALERAEAATPAAVLGHVKQVLQLAKDIVPIYEDATVEEKRRILNLVCYNWTLKGKKLNYQINKPFAELAEGLKNGKWCPV